MFWNLPKILQFIEWRKINNSAREKLKKVETILKSNSKKYCFKNEEGIKRKRNFVWSSKSKFMGALKAKCKLTFSSSVIKGERCEYNAEKKAGHTVDKMKKKKYSHGNTLEQKTVKLERHLVTQADWWRTLRKLWIYTKGGAEKCLLSRYIVTQ